MKTVDITLDGQTYAVAEMHSRANAEWRARLQHQVENVSGVLTSAPETDLTDSQALARLTARVSQLVLESVDTIRELAESYAPDLPWAEAYDSEIVSAFWQILGLAFPFGLAAVKDWTARLAAVGSPTPPTKPN